MSNKDDKHLSRSSSTSSEATSHWVDTERPAGIEEEGGVISETVSTSQMRPTNVAEDIIGYASGYLDQTKSGMMSPPGVQQVNYSQVTKTATYQQTTSTTAAGNPSAGLPAAAIDAASAIESHGVMPRSAISGAESAFSSVHHETTSTSMGQAGGVVGATAEIMASSTTVGGDEPIPLSAIEEAASAYGSTSGAMQSTSISQSISQSAMTSGAVAAGGMTSVECAGTVTQTLPIVAAGGAKEVECCKYELNRDANPIVITKQPEKPIHYDQNIGVRYLKPPTPPPPGPIIVREVRPPPIPEAPPLYVKLRPDRPKTPPPLIIREAPPLPPKPLPPQVIDKVLPPAPPPPRKVIVEKLPPLPPKPRQVIIEKWLPYEQVKRKIVYQRLPDLPPAKEVKNTLITWSPFKADVTRRYHNLGVVRANPAAYSAQHSHEMMDSQSTMNAMAQLGAGLHYSSAAGAHASSSKVYLEDKAELSRLMHTNFHPNEPVCKEFLAGAQAGAFGVSAGGVLNCPPPTLEDTQQMLSEARQMAAVYGSQYGASSMYSSAQLGGGHFDAPCAALSSATPWMASAYGVPCDMIAASNFCQDVLSMYPQYCEGAQFIPPPTGPFM